MPELLAHGFSTLGLLLGREKESLLNWLRLLKSPQYKYGIYFIDKRLSPFYGIAATAVASLTTRGFCSHPHDFQQPAYRMFQQRLSPLDLRQT